MDAIDDLKARDPSTLTRGERAALARHAVESAKPQSGEGGAYALSPEAVEAARAELARLSPAERRKRLASETLATSLATMRSPTSTTRDAMAAAGLSARVSGLLREREVRPATYRLPAVSLLAGQAACCDKCGQPLPAVVEAKKVD